MTSVGSATVALVFAAVTAQAASVKEVFEKYDLLGTFAIDCSKPPSPDNWYFVNHTVDDGHVQRDMMTGPTTRTFVFLYDQVSESKANEIAIRGARDGAPLEAIWRVEKRRQVETETTLRGRKVISGGKFLSNGRDVPWINKCDASIQRGETPPRQLIINGTARTFLLEQPTTRGPHPTIIVMHGYTKDAADIAAATGLSYLAPRQGFVAVFPNGLGHQWNHYLPGTELPFFVEESRKFGGIPDDVAFLKTLVVHLVERGIADPRQVYLVGESNGGFMAMRMICSNAEMFAAVGVLIGGMPDPLGAGCHPAKPIPVLMVHGSADRIVPYNGGVVPVGAPIPVWPAVRTVAFFRRLNGCVEPGERTLAPGQHAYTVEIERSMKCRSGPVVFYRIVGGGHDRWPDLNVGQQLLDFFNGKTR